MVFQGRLIFSTERSTKSGKYTEWINHITYKYDDAGTSHTSLRIGCTYYPYRDKTKAEWVKERFPEGHGTSAWIDPADPRQAVLLSFPAEPAIRERNGMQITAGIMVVTGLFVGLLIHWLLMRRNRRLMRELEMDVWQSRTV